MSGTTEHITIRLPKWLVDELREQAKLQQRSLAWMIGYRCAQLASNESGRGVVSGTQGARAIPQQVSSPAAPKKGDRHEDAIPESSPRDSSAAQKLYSGVARNSMRIPSTPSVPEDHIGNSSPSQSDLQSVPEYVRVSQACPKCGALNGHQKWCKK